MTTARHPVEPRFPLMPDPDTDPAGWSAWAAILCRWAQKTFGLVCGLDPEESHAVAMTVCVRCLRRYVPGVARFSTYFASAYLRERARHAQRWARSPRSPKAAGRALISLSEIGSSSTRDHEDWQPPDTVASDPGDEAAARVDCGEVLKRLHPRDAELLMLRFGYELDMETIGRRHGITRERVRQITERALIAARQRAGVVCAC